MADIATRFLTALWSRRAPGPLARAKARYFGGQKRVKRLALAGNRDYDPERFEDLVLFIAWAMRDDPHFGRTKLAKTLFYVDFDAYAGEGASLTGSTYEHWDHGPFPPQLYDVERKLAREGRARALAPTPCRSKCRRSRRHESVLAPLLEAGRL